MKGCYPKRKIKVCHVITKMVYGGASLGTLHLVQGLDQECFESTIICGIQSENEGSLLADIKDRKFDVIIIPEIVREINLVKDIKAFFKLTYVLRTNEYDVVHTHGSKAGVIGRLAAALSRVPIVLFTVHGWGLKAGSFLVCRIFRLIERVLAVFTTKILFQTQADMTEAIFYKIGKLNQYMLIGNGINLRPFIYRNKERARRVKRDLGATNKMIVGTVGRVSVQKNPVGFIAIAAQVLKQRDDVIFVFVGGGEMLGDMEDLVKKQHLENRVLFMGVRDDVPEVMTNFDVFILTSQWEGMPRSLIEAMSLSKPVVVNAIGGIGELITDGDNGFVVPVNETSRYAARIEYLLNNPRVATRIGKCAFRKAKEYDYGDVVEKVKKIYLDLCKFTT
jgi:glycosyltransferase involved in cell wall biosynthesis